MVGVPVRVHDLTGDDLGIAHVPSPIEPGDLVLLEHAELRIADVVSMGPSSPLAALVRAQPIHLRRAVQRGW
jgi:hypothetical protein